MADLTWLQQRKIHLRWIVYHTLKLLCIKVKIPKDIKH